MYIKRQISKKTCATTAFKSNKQIFYGGKKKIWLRDENQPTSFKFHHMHLLMHKKALCFLFT